MGWPVDHRQSIIDASDAELIEQVFVAAQPTAELSAEEGSGCV